MLNKFMYLLDLCKDSVAIFQENICIFEKGINDFDLLAFISKNLWVSSSMNTITVTYFQEYIFSSYKYKFEDENYLFVRIIKKKKTTPWTAKQWDDFFKSTLIFVSILATTETYSVDFDSSFMQSKPPKFLEEVSSTKGFLDPETELDFSDNYQLENILIESFKSGDTLMLSKLTQQLSSISSTALSENKFIEKKYRLVSLITLLTRASIRYNCPPRLSYRLSDNLIKKMDNITTESEIKSFLTHLVSEFSILIKKNAIPKKSYLINQIIEYVYSNLYSDLSNKGIAQEMTVNPSYLSTVFKKEVGQGLMQFIKVARVNEAKYLLTQTSLSLKEISESLQFTNQSYFCKIFKAETSYTPYEFRTLF